MSCLALLDTSCPFFLSSGYFYSFKDASQILEKNKVIVVGIFVVGNENGMENIIEFCYFRFSSLENY